MTFKTSAQWPTIARLTPRPKDTTASPDSFAMFQKYNIPIASPFSSVKTLIYFTEKFHELSITCKLSRVQFNKLLYYCCTILRS